MKGYQETFEAAEQARIRGDNETAVELYAKADTLLDLDAETESVELHHMWGVVLISLGRTDEARQKLEHACARTSDEKLRAAINRDYSRSHLIDGQLPAAMHFITLSLNSTPASDLAERGASFGFKARILLAQGKLEEALEIFGMADVLLQRSGNHHYELYNLMHFMEALSEHETPFILDSQPDIVYAEAQVPRFRSLAETYGGPPHRDRAEHIVDKIFADREA